MRATILTQQVGHYHAARYRAAGAVMPALQVLAAMGEADFPELLSGVGSDIHVDMLFRTRAEYRAATRNEGLRRRLDGVLSAHDPDVVIVAGWAFPESLAAIAWARRRRKAVVLMSESQVQDGSRHTLREKVKRRVVSLSDAALVGAPTHRDYVVELGVADDRVFLGYDAVDNAHFATGSDLARQDAPSHRAALRLPARYILASARFVPKKNLPGLVAAYARAIEGLSAPDLVLLGDGDERASIEAAIREHGLEARVHLHGFKTYSDLPIYYGLAEGFAHVSFVEQWGLVINEAAASGLPLVVSRSCGAASVLVEPGRNGWLVDANDFGDIASALRALMTADPQARARMGDESRRIVGDWGPERFADGLRAACLMAVGQPHRGLPLADGALLRVLGRIEINEVK